MLWLLPAKGHVPRALLGDSYGTRLDETDGFRKRTCGTYRRMIAEIRDHGS